MKNHFFFVVIFKMDLNKKLEEQSEFENLIWKHTEESLGKAKTMISDFNPIWIQNLIFNVAQFSPFSFEILAQFYKETRKSKMPIHISNSFATYLFMNQIISKEDFYSEKDFFSLPKIPTQLYQPFQKDSITKIIQEDDIHGFTSYLSAHDIDIQNLRVWIYDTQYTIIDFACFWGAISILKYLLLNKVSITENTLQSAIKGGVEPIIELLDSKGFSFNGYISLAIKFHRNEISKWLFNKYGLSKSILLDCIQYFNTDLLLFFMKEKGTGLFSESEFDSNYQLNCIQKAMEMNNTFIFELLKRYIDFDIVPNT